METIDVILKKAGIIPVVKIEDEEIAVPYAQALLDGGIDTIEITFRTSSAAKSIERISRQLPEMTVCAGTVLAPEQAALATACGAKAIVSPGTNPAVVSWCDKNGYPIYPGCATPTEVEAALALGVTTLKLFPAEVIGGINMLKAMYGPYGGIRFLPTGGISPENLEEYLSQPNVIACGGSWLCPKEAMESRDWKAVTELAKEAKYIVDNVRSKYGQR